MSPKPLVVVLLLSSLLGSLPVLAQEPVAPPPDQALSPDRLDAVRDEVLAVNGHQRHHDPKADQVNEHRQEDDADGWLSHGTHG